MAFSNYTPSPRPKNFGQPVQETQMGENNSGQGPNTPVPDIVARKFNWGAFLLSWIWGLGNKTYITLLIFLVGFIPFIGIVLIFGMQIWFGIKGNTWAWQNKRFQSVEHFHENQKKWAIAGVIVGVIGLFIQTIIICSTFFVLKQDHSRSMYVAYKMRYTSTIENQVRMLEATEQKCNLSSIGLTSCFEDTFPSGERAGNSIKPSSYDKNIILTFEGNGSCKQEGDCKVIFQIGECNNQEIAELPLYANDNGYIYIKKEDSEKMFERAE